MTRLSRWCFEHRRRVVAGWLLAVLVVLGLSQVAGSRFSSDFSLPGTDSQAAVTLLTQNFPVATGEGDEVVIQALHGSTVRSPAVEATVTAVLARVAKVPGVQAVGSPYSSQGQAQVSRDAAIAFATVTWDKVPGDMTTTDAANLGAAIAPADHGDVRLSLSGQVISGSEGAGPGLSVVVGVIAALSSCFSSSAARCSPRCCR
jgi:RND superfamily putative drug exporter